MITLNELNPHDVKLTAEQNDNLPKLYNSINQIRHLWNHPMIVTSGVRSVEDHKRIYLEKAQKSGLKNIRIPMGSMHLKAAAVDIADTDGSLYSWCKANPEALSSAGLSCEEGTQGWVHFQIYPPRSGKRWFYP